MKVQELVNCGFGLWVKLLAENLERFLAENLERFRKGLVRRPTDPKAPHPRGPVGPYAGRTLGLATRCGSDDKTKPRAHARAGVGLQRRGQGIVKLEKPVPHKGLLLRTAYLSTCEGYIHVAQS